MKKYSGDDKDIIKYFNETRPDFLTENDYYKSCNMEDGEIKDKFIELEELEHRLETEKLSNQDAKAIIYDLDKIRGWLI